MQMYIKGCSKRTHTHTSTHNKYRKKRKFGDAYADTVTLKCIQPRTQMVRNARNAVADVEFFVHLCKWWCGLCDTLIFVSFEFSDEELERKSEMNGRNRQTRTRAGADDESRETQSDRLNESKGRIIGRRTCWRKADTKRN